MFGKKISQKGLNVSKLVTGNLAPVKLPPESNPPYVKVRVMVRVRG